jgi:hypothetical protein
VNAGSDAEKRVQADLARLREAAERITGSVFFGTMLSTMRESGMKGRYGHGGRGEEVFAAQLHGILAERAGGAASGGGLARHLYRRLEHQQTLLSTRMANGE